jgi:putative ABC transport system permease protein
VVIFIVIFINTINKRRQIGILKAIGINKRIIVYSYIIQVLIIATCGILLGLALSSGLVTYLTYNPLVFPGGAVYPVVESGPVIRSVISLALVSLISGFIPSWKTANEPILDAIRGQ